MPEQEHQEEIVPQGDERKDQESGTPVPSPSASESGNLSYLKTMQEMGQDFMYNLKLLEERDQELNKSDLEIHKLKVRFAERGAEVNDLKEQVLALSSKLSTLQEENDTLISKKLGKRKMAASETENPLEYDKDEDSSSSKLMNCP